MAEAPLGPAFEAPAPEQPPSDACISAAPCQQTDDGDDDCDCDGVGGVGGENGGRGWWDPAAAGEDDGLFVSMDRPTQRARLARLRLRRWSRSSGASASSSLSMATTTTATVTAVPATATSPAVMTIPLALPSFSSLHPSAATTSAAAMLATRRNPRLERHYSETQIRQTTARISLAVENKSEAYETKYSGSVTTSKNCNLSGKSSTLSSSSSATKNQKSFPSQFLRRIRQFASIFDLRSKHNLQPERHQYESLFSDLAKIDVHSQDSPQSMSSSLSSNVPPTIEIAALEAQTQFLRSLPSLDLSTSMPMRGSLDCRIANKMAPTSCAFITGQSGLTAHEEEFRTLRRANTLGGQQQYARTPTASLEESRTNESILRTSSVFEAAPRLPKQSSTVSMRKRFQIQKLPRSEAPAAISLRNDEPTQRGFLRK